MPSNRFDSETAFGGKYELFRDTWLANGFNEVLQEKVSIEDVISTPNAALWMPKVIEEIVREAVEPMLVIPALLDRVEFNAAARFTFPAMGSLVAYDLAENQAYPEQQLQVAPGSMTINIGKTGLAFKISEEMRRYSQYDIINMHIRKAKQALDRHKEKKGFNFISGMGVTLFDNIRPTTSVFGTCTGRSLSGAGNGSCRMEDLLKAYAHIMMQGFVPNAMLIHPMAWALWLTDPLLQAIVKNTGSGQWFQNHNMARSGNPWAAANQGKKGQTGTYGKFTPSGNAASETPTKVTAFDQNLKSAAVIPGYFPYPINVVVSPFAPYNPGNNTCDIMLFDSENLGALVVDEDVVVDQWEDPSVDIMKVKLRERYAFAIYEEGLAIGVLRNIPIKANEIVFPAQTTISAAGSISELNVTTPISGL